MSATAPDQPQATTEAAAARAWRIALALVPGVAALVAAWPILQNQFVGDDFAHLFEMACFGPGEFVTSPWSGHMYVVRNLFFYLSYLAFGMDPAGYFVVVLGTHAVVSTMVATLARRLTDDALASSLAGVLFAVAPATLGTLGWYAVYGHALAGATVLAGLLAIAPGPGERAGPPTRGRIVLAAASMLVASQCFGTGAAVALVFPVIAALLRPAIVRDATARLVAVATPILVLVAWVVMTSRRTRLNQGGFETTELLVAFATDVRTIGRVLLHLLGMAIDGLLLGRPFDLMRAEGVVGVATACTFVVAVAVAAYLADARSRRVIAACTIAALACYGSIAAGRAVLYVAITRDFVAALAHATRYHYLAYTVLAVLVAVTLDVFVRRAALPRHLVVAAIGAWTAWAFASAFVVPVAVNSLDSSEGFRQAAEKQVATSRASIERAVHAVAVGRTACLPIEPAPLILGFPGSFGVYVLYYPTDQLDGRRIRFVTSDPKILALRDAGGRAKNLLLPVGECRP